MNRRLTVCALAGAALLAGRMELEAQVRRGRDSGPATGWAPVAVGVRAGWDNRANGEILGAQVRIPVVRSGIVELAPNAEMVFLTGTKEYQYNIEAAWVPMGVEGGVFVKGGVGWRDSVFGSLDSTGARTTYFGYVVGAGGRSRLGRVDVELDIRWTFLNDTSYRPGALTLGLSYPFWRVGPGS